MTGTRDKLNAAKHFLKELYQSQGNRTDFVRTFSAFVTAGQGVLEVMQAEFKRKAEGFEDWYREKKVSMDSLPLFAFMKDMRDADFHQT